MKNKLLSFILCITLVLSCLMVTMTPIAAETTEPENAAPSVVEGKDTFWDKTIKQPTSDADGDGYIDIGLPSELAYVIDGGGNEDGKWELANDIWLNDMKVSVADGVPTVTKASDGTEITDLSTLNTWYKDKTVKGTFKGNGNVVHGVFYNDYSETADKISRGLFPKAGNELHVSGIGVEDAYITSNTTYRTAALIGYVSKVNGSVDACYVGDSVYLYGDELGGLIGGGTLGDTQIFALKNSCSLATLKHHDDDPKDSNNTYIVNGLIGDNWGWSTGVIENCFAISDTKLVRKGTATNCLQIKTANAESFKGIKAVEAFGNFSDEFVTTENGYPTHKTFIKDYNEFSNFPLIGKYFETGTGTETDPYIIETAGQLRYCVGTFGEADKYYKLANDIYLNDTAKVAWATGTPIEGYSPNVWFGGQTVTATGKVYKGIDGTEAVFNGHIDGDGYTVYGIYGQPMENYSVEESGRYFISGGLIPVIGTASVKNLNIKKSFVAGGRNTGGVVGYVVTKATLDSISVDETVTVAGGNAQTLNGDTSSYTGSAIGGIVGFVPQNAEASLNNCGFSGSIVDQNNKITHEWGLIGTHYNSTVTISDSFSLGYPPLCSDASGTHGSKRNITVSNVYSNKEPSKWITDIGTVNGTITVVSSVTGENALSDENMANLDKTVWYAVKDSVKAPMLRSYGTNIGDVDENGKGCELTDAVALRTHLIGAAEYKNTDKNRDGNADICDLVAIAQEITVMNDDWRSHPEDFKLLAFTFDDGPDPYNTTSVTARVADLFAEYNGSATFFLIGKYLEQEGGVEIAKYALSKGSELASHSYSHQDSETMAELSEEEFTKEIDGNNQLIKELTGYTPKFFRGGGFARNDRIYERLEKLNMPAVGSYVAFGGDYSGGEGTVDSIVNNILGTELPDGAIILAHSSNSKNITPDALEIILPELYKQGYRFCTMSELFEYKGVDYDTAPIHCYITRVETTEDGSPEVHTKWRTYLDSWKTHPEDYKLLAFTFDDGPRTKKDNRMVELFAKYKGSATMFVTGTSCASNGYESLQNAINNGWDIGSHSMSHADAYTGSQKNGDYTELTYDELKYQIADFNDLLEANLTMADGATPYEVSLYRPPQIRTTETMFDVCIEENMLIIWALRDTYDWSSSYDEAARLQVLKDGVGTWIDGDIILGHITQDTTYNGLAATLEDFYDAGYRFCSVTELMKYRGIERSDISGKLNNVDGNKGMVTNIVNAATYGKAE